MTIYRKILLGIIAFFIATGCSTSAQTSNPKREFRGAWLHVIGQTQYMNKGTNQQKAYISDQFDKLQAAGVNAVIFQVRPTADALYKSDLEPWSYWLTGKRGKAPEPMWDPLEYAVQEAHKRGMELHAWLNPYRVTSSPKEVLPESHDIHKHPERYVKFDGKIFFDPAYQENRDFICEVVDDIVNRYDVDAIHMDDYFYPYPASNGTRFNGDNQSYALFGNGMERNAWRRHNVDLLIEQLHATIKNRKPWVRFGVSPFGIWRNKRNDPRGSDSNGLQNYDDLYADVLLWADKGWVDYVAPQLYWSLDLKVAPSRHLADWWARNIPENVQLYIGQDTKRTMDSPDPGNNSSNELETKIKLSRKLKNVDGNVWWHGYWVTDNYKGVADKLSSDFQSTIAIPPAFGDAKKLPAKVENLRVERTGGKTFLMWEAPRPGKTMRDTDAVKFVVYGFFPGEDSYNLEDAETIIAMTPHEKVLISDDADPESVKGMTYVVTAIDRMNRESLPVHLRMR